MLKKKIPKKHFALRGGRSSSSTSSSRSQPRPLGRSAVLVLLVTGGGRSFVTSLAALPGAGRAASCLLATAASTTNSSLPTASDR